MKCLMLETKHVHAREIALSPLNCPSAAVVDADNDDDDDHDNTQHAIRQPAFRQQHPTNRNGWTRTGNSGLCSSRSSPLRQMTSILRKPSLGSVLLHHPHVPVSNRSGGFTANTVFRFVNWGRKIGIEGQQYAQTCFCFSLGLNNEYPAHDRGPLATKSEFPARHKVTVEIRESRDAKMQKENTREFLLEGSANMKNTLNNCLVKNPAPFVTAAKSRAWHHGMKTAYFDPQHVTTFHAAKHNAGLQYLNYGHELCSDPQAQEQTTRVWLTSTRGKWHHDKYS